MGIFMLGLTSLLVSYVLPAMPTPGVPNVITCTYYALYLVGLYINIPPVNNTDTNVTTKYDMHKVLLVLCYFNRY